MAQTIARSRIYFHTGNYELAHGKRPRGVGLWMFQVRGVNKEEGMFQASGSYSTAKEIVKRQIQAKLGTTIPVDVFRSIEVDVLW